MGKMDRLPNRVETFAAQFWALSNVLAIPITPDPASRPGITPPPYTKHVLFKVFVGSILNKDAPDYPLFLSSMLLIYGLGYTSLIFICYSTAIQSYTTINTTTSSIVTIISPGL